VEEAVPRIPWPDEDTLTETARKILAGSPLNVVRIGAHASPALFEAQGRLSYAISDPEVLDPRIREVAILRVAQLSNSAYELHHHRPLARAAGLSEAEIAAILAGDYGALDPTAAAIARFTDEVVLNLSPTDATMAALRAEVSDRVVVNILLTIGCYMSVARLIAATGIELDEVAIEHLASGIEDRAR
jgi:AhpD family alkylhydroperoxidase